MDKGKLGYVQGNMSPSVDDFQAKEASYSQKDANKTTEYIARTNKTVNKQGADIRKQAHKGRYD